MAPSGAGQKNLKKKKKSTVLALAWVKDLWTEKHFMLYLGGGANALCGKWQISGEGSMTTLTEECNDIEW